MLTDTIKKQIADATVTLIAKGEPNGRGVLVAGGMILTAAHCIEYSAEEMPGGNEPVLQQIKRDGKLFRLATRSVEQVADVALLCSTDGQQGALEEDAVAYERFCESVTAVTVCTSSVQEEPFAVFVLTHQGNWLEGTARPRKWMLSVEFIGKVPTGTSGSPIVNLKGEIVGLISALGGTDDHPCGLAPRPHLTVPVWAMNLITQIQHAESV